MTHEELRDRLLDLACGELSPAEGREVEAHAAGCEPCRAELERMRGTRRMMAALPVEPAPERGEAILLAAAREGARVRPPVRRWATLLQVAALAASLAAVGTVSWRLLAAHPDAPQDLSLSPRSAREESETKGAQGLSLSPRGAGGEGGVRGDEPALAVAPRSVREKAEANRAEPEAQDLSLSARSAREKGEAKRAERESQDLSLSARSAGEKAEAKRAERESQGLSLSPRGAGGEGGVRGEEPPRMAAAPMKRAAPAAPPAPSAPATAFAAPPPAVADAPAAPAPAARLSRAAAKPSAEREAAKAAAGEADAAATDPVARYEALRAAGRLRADLRMGPGCAGGTWRRVERDPEGRVAGYAWDEVRGGRRVILEAIYGPDGAVAARRARDAETRAPLAAEATPDFTAPPATGVDLDAPPACP